MKKYQNLFWRIWGRLLLAGIMFNNPAKDSDPRHSPQGLLASDHSGPWVIGYPGNPEKHMLVAVDQVILVPAWQLGRLQTCVFFRLYCLIWVVLFCFVSFVRFVLGCCFFLGFFCLGLFVLVCFGLVWLVQRFNPIVQGSNILNHLFL